MEQPLVQTQYGWVSGRAHEDVHSFLGIPYAKPPVGPLRFCRPSRQHLGRAHGGPMHTVMAPYNMQKPALRPFPPTRRIARWSRRSISARTA